MEEFNKEDIRRLHDKGLDDEDINYMHLSMISAMVAALIEENEKEK